MGEVKKHLKEVPEKLRYSDEELLEFKEIIVKKLEKAREDLRMLMEAYTMDGEHGTDDTSPTFKVLEEGYQVMSKEENSRLASRQQKFINSLENALLRIENKSYGICRVTGKLISKERLRSVPHATLSIEAKLSQPSNRQQ
jgi:RNA polymerase-binding transcription factor DksA